MGSNVSGHGVPAESAVSELGRSLLPVGIDRSVSAEYERPDGEADCSEAGAKELSAGWF